MLFRGFERKVYSTGEKAHLLKIARDAMTAAVLGETLEKLDTHSFPESFMQVRGSFVTLTKQGMLRGCIGTVDAYQPLVNDIAKNAGAAATRDYRFQPVSEEELSQINIEISILSPLDEITYSSEQELIDQIESGGDGILITDGVHRSTFLPQVWGKIPKITDFLDHLCQKMGLRANSWRSGNFRVFKYSVEEFHE